MRWSSESAWTVRLATLPDTSPAIARVSATAFQPEFGEQALNVFQPEFDAETLQAVQPREILPIWRE